jgi:hypothetical protein
MLTDWISQQIRSYKAFTAMPKIGETVTRSGRVVEKWKENGKWLAKVELFAENPKAQTLIVEAVVMVD